MFSVFEDLILKVETVLNNAEFIADNHDLIMRSIDRVDIILTEQLYLKTSSILYYDLDISFNSLPETIEELGFI